MSDTGPGQELARPRQVTVAAIVIILGSIFVLLTAWDEMAQIHSLDTRERVQAVIDDTPGSFGIDVSQALMVLRVCLLVAAATAVAAGVLGYRVLRRDRAARIGLTVVAAPMFLTGLVTGGFVSSVVAAFAVMLWFQPAKDWFDGRAAREADASSRPGTSGGQDRSHGGWGASPGTSDRPQEHRPVGSSDHDASDRQAGESRSQPTAPYAAPGLSGGQQSNPYAGQQPYGAQQQGPYGAQQPGRYPGHPGGLPPRPPALITACILTWICSAFAGFICLVLIAMMVGSPDALMDEMSRQDPNFDQGLNHDDIVAATVFMSAVVIAWCTVAIAFAVVAWMGRGWGRMAMIFTVAPAAALMLLSAVVAVVTIVPAAVAVLTIVLLTKPATRAYFDERDRLAKLGQRG